MDNIKDHNKVMKKEMNKYKKISLKLDKIDIKLERKKTLINNEKEHLSDMLNESINYYYNIIRNLRNRYPQNPHKDVTRLIELLSNLKT